MYAQYLRFLPVAGLRFTFYALRFIPIALRFANCAVSQIVRNNLKPNSTNSNPTYHSKHLPKTEVQAVPKFSKHIIFSTIGWISEPHPKRAYR